MPLAKDEVNSKLLFGPMARSVMREYGLTRDALLGMLTAAMDIPPEGRAVLTVRLKLLGRLGVPTLSRSLRNQRLRFGLRETTEIAVALALMNAHMPPTLAARYLRERWLQLAQVIVDGLLCAIEADPKLVADYARSPPARGFYLEGTLLSSLRSREDRTGGDLIDLADVVPFYDLVSIAPHGNFLSGLLVSCAPFLPILAKPWLFDRLSTPAMTRAAFDRLLLPPAQVPAMASTEFQDQRSQIPSNTGDGEIHGGERGSDRESN